MESGPTPEPSGSAAAYGVPAKITDASNTYRGVAQPTVEFVNGSTVLGTNTSSVSDPLGPGQSETVWVDYPDYPGTQGAYIVAQLVNFWYSVAPDVSGTNVALLPT